MFQSRIFVTWLIAMLGLWVALFTTFASVEFLAEHWHYPAIMVLGAFVAGLTPEGGGAVAFPVLSVFFEIDRAMARDFSLMIQSVGMTSASLFILTTKGADLRAYRPVLALVPVAFAGFVVGMLTLQTTPVFLIQALFLSLITTFAIAYVFGEHRGDRLRLETRSRIDFGWLGAVAFVGGLCASLFGTGADIVIYTLLVTRFRMKEKVATHISIMVMAAISVLGYVYRGAIEQELTAYQISTWLCAYPVVLFMAPFGAYVLSRLNVEHMLKFVIVLNVGQLAYFNLNKPAPEKTIASLILSAVLMALFWALMRRTAKQASAERAATRKVGEETV